MRGTNEAIKYDHGKPKLYEIFQWVDHPFLEELMNVLKFGAEKYERNQWKLGIKDENRLANAVLRHLDKHMSGETKDPESGQSHLAHATASLMFLHYYERVRSEPLLKCSKCGKYLPKSEFYERPDRPRGYSSRCKACTSRKFPPRKFLILEDYAVIQLQNNRGMLVDIDVAHAFYKMNRKVFVDSYGYAIFKDDNKNPVKFHHFVTGKPASGNSIHHINGDKLDNRRCNLKEVSVEENSALTVFDNFKPVTYPSVSVSETRPGYYQATYHVKLSNTEGRQVHLISGTDYDSVKLNGTLRLSKLFHDGKLDNQIDIQDEK